MIVPILNPLGLQVHVLDASAQADGREVVLIVDDEVPSVELTRGVAHAENDAIRIASTGAMRMAFIGTVGVL